MNLGRLFLGGIFLSITLALPSAWSREPEVQPEPNASIRWAEEEDFEALRALYENPETKALVGFVSNGENQDAEEESFDSYEYATSPNLSQTIKFRGTLEVNGEEGVVYQLIPCAQLLGTPEIH